MRLAVRAGPVHGRLVQGLTAVIRTQVSFFPAGTVSWPIGCWRHRSLAATERCGSMAVAVRLDPWRWCLKAQRRQCRKAQTSLGDVGTHQSREMGRGWPPALLGAVFGGGVAAVLVALEVLLAGHGPTAAPHCGSDQGHREKALHGRGASIGNSTRLCASRLLFAALSSQTTKPRPLPRPPAHPCPRGARFPARAVIHGLEAEVLRSARIAFTSRLVLEPPLGCVDPWGVVAEVLG
jgi:hypothetical protein